jgi:hypothetical protein
MTDSWDSIPLMFQNFVELRIKYYLELYDRKMTLQFERYDALLAE